MVRFTIRSLERFTKTVSIKYNRRRIAIMKRVSQLEV